MLWVFFLGCLSGAGLYAWWMERRRPMPNPPVDLDEEVMQRGERAVAAIIAFRKGEMRMPDILQ